MKTPIIPKFRALEFLLGRSTSSSELCPPDFEADAQAQLSLLRSTLKVLVVGAGGLGCEMLKDLALSGFASISVIDMDTIDVSNLNRQFLFTEKDVGCSKAVAAARAIMRRFGGTNNQGQELNASRGGNGTEEENSGSVNSDGGVTVTAHHAKIEDMPPSFYRQFHVVVLGLDSLEARSYLNSVLCSFLEYNDADEDNDMNEGISNQEIGDNNIQLDRSTIIPIVDAGTEGFAGHTRVIYPGITPCIQCTMWLYPPQTTFPLCTLAETPRSPAHCIEYVKLVQWAAERGADRQRLVDDYNGNNNRVGEELKNSEGGNDSMHEVDAGVIEEFDPDNSEHMQWIYKKALARAEMFGIEGVTMRLTMGVVKNIIPAIPSTNAIMSAAAVLEVIKICTMFSKGLDNYIMFSGTRGVYMHNVSYERDPQCIVCSPGLHISVNGNDTLGMFIQKLISDQAFGGRLQNPSVSYQSRNLYMTGILEAETRGNLSRSLFELVGSSNLSDQKERILLSINDKGLPCPKRCWVTLLKAQSVDTINTSMEHQ